MTHFICTGGCHGVSDKTQACEDEACEKYGEQLEPCDCTDNLHGGRQEKKEN